MRCYPFLTPCMIETTADIQYYYGEKEKTLEFNPGYPWPGVEYQGGALACP